MTRLSRESAVPAVSADVVFPTRRFPNYKIGVNNEIIDVKDEPQVSPLREAVARETALLLEQHKRLSVRDLAKQFEQGLAFANQSEEDKHGDLSSLEKHVILKKLRDSLESLNGRVVGKNKDDAEEAIALVEALAVQLTQSEVELIQEKAEVRKLSNILKQAAEDAKKIIEEERAFARSEIEKAKEAVKRVEEAIKEQDRISEVSGKQDLDKLMKEVQEARRIKMLHQPSKVMDMEHELQALRSQLAEKHKQSLQLQKELAMCRKSSNDSLSHVYELDGLEALGSILQIQCTSDTSAELSTCSAQWYRLSRDMSKQLILGATKTVYAPEPFDVGKTLLVEIISDGQLFTLTSTGPIDPAPGLGSYVESLARKHDTEFKVVISQMNGQRHPVDSIHLLHIGKMRIKLRKGKSTIVKENYTSSMQLCGVRGGGDAAPQAAFWQPKKGLNFILAFESHRDRNAAIMLSRRFAFDCNIVLAGPGDGSNET